MKAGTNARFILVSTLVLFGLLVGGLTAFGSGFLKQMAVCDAEVSYLDLARQAVDQRDYNRASDMYKQALIYARAHDPSGQSEAAMLLTYAKFAYEKQNNLPLARQLQARAKQLKQQTASADKQASSGIPH